MLKKAVLFLLLYTPIFSYAQASNEYDLFVAGYIYEDYNQGLSQFATRTKDSIKFENAFNYFQTIPNRNIEKDTLGIKVKSIVTDNKISMYYSSDKIQYDYHYFKVEDTEYTIDQIKKIKGNRYVTDINKVATIPNRDLKITQEIYFIDSDNVEITYTYNLNNKIIYTEKEIKKIIIQSKDNKVFINFYDGEPSLYTRFYQLNDLQEDKFSLIHYAETKKIVDVYTLNSRKHIENNSTHFKICYERRPYEYYNFESDIEYIHGNKALFERVSKNAPLTEGNGYITLHFAINCKGKVGRFGLEQMDSKYQSALYNPELVKYLIQEISKITEWNLPEDISTDIHRFIMFKVTNGKITEVCP